MLDGKTCIYVISKGCEFHLFPWQRCTEKSICGKVCQSLVDVWWDYFRTSVSSINKTYHHNVTQMWMKNGFYCACIFYKEITKKNFRQNEADETGIFIVIKMKIFGFHWLWT